MDQMFYFVDTRENAKSEEPFAIHNPDVAKKWTKEFGSGEGHFKPVDIDESDFQINRRDLKEAGLNTVDHQKAAAEKNLELLATDTENPYKEMSKQELMDELDARGIEYKKNGPESTNDFYRALLVADDKE